MEWSDVTVERVERMGKSSEGEEYGEVSTCWNGLLGQIAAVFPSIEPVGRCGAGTRRVGRNVASHGDNRRDDSDNNKRRPMHLHGQENTSTPGLRFWGFLSVGEPKSTTTTRGRRWYLPTGGATTTTTVAAVVATALDNTETTLEKMRTRKMIVTLTVRLQVAQS